MQRGTNGPPSERRAGLDIVDAALLELGEGKIAERQKRGRTPARRKRQRTIHTPPSIGGRRISAGAIGHIFGGWPGPYLTIVRVGLGAGATGPAGSRGGRRGAGYRPRLAWVRQS